MLPTCVGLVPFTNYSSYPLNTVSKNRNSQIKRRNIIIGGRYGGGFHELIVDDEKSAIECKSFENDYDKQFANLKYIGLNDAKHTHSYLVQNNRYLVVFVDKRYNVYDMKNDKWLINLNAPDTTNLIKNGNSSRSVLLNDEIIIISRRKSLWFYFIGNNHITNPLLIYTYKLKTENISYVAHGMSIIDFREESCYDQRYKIQLILFGGWNNCILSSFLHLDILLSYTWNLIEKSIQHKNISIDEKLINRNLIKLNNIDPKQMEYTWCRFGFECIMNDKNEAIIIMVGGNAYIPNANGTNIHLYNCATHELECKQNVLPFECQYYPGTIMKYKKKNQFPRIVIVQDKEYCIFNIYAHYIEWKIERIIWIGFSKNDSNNECFIDQLPKDLIIYILSLLGKQQLLSPYIIVKI